MRAALVAEEALEARRRVVPQELLPSAPSRHTDTRVDRITGTRAPDRDDVMWEIEGCEEAEKRAVAPLQRQEHAQLQAVRLADLGQPVPQKSRVCAAVVAMSGSGEHLRGSASARAMCGALHVGVHTVRGANVSTKAS